MISIVICSRSKVLLSSVSDNIYKTIGLPCEIIAIDNSEGKYGICEAYNLGANQSKYEVLCFMHEDILFHTEDWGKIVCNVLSDVSIGVLGVAGSQLQVKAPAGWWASSAEHYRLQVLQTINGKTFLDKYNPLNEVLADVCVLDGVWLCSRKDVWGNNKFDEVTFSQFHFYDIDYCATVFRNYRICVTFDILIEHFSMGSINKVWIDNCVKYYRKWFNYLPLSVVNVNKKIEVELEVNAIDKFIFLLLENEQSVSKVLYWLVEILKRTGIDRRILGIIKRFIQFKLNYLA